MTRISGNIQATFESEEYAQEQSTSGTECQAKSPWRWSAVQSTLRSRSALRMVVWHPLCNRLEAADCREPVASQSSGLFPSHKRRQASDDNYPHPGKMSRPMIERPEPEIYPDHVEEPDDNPLESNPSEYQQWTNQPGTKQESGHAGLDDIIRDVIENFPFA